MNNIEYNQCSGCMMDCENYVKGNKCEHFKKARPVAEYNRIVREENRNLHKFCDKNNLKYSELMKMLRYKKRFLYKYRVLLENFIYEKDEWIEWENEGCRTYGEE